jgi:MinD superfamily P-loop ATPase
MYKIAFVSGKGGTGKTTVAVNLAKLLSVNMKVLLVDLDVEEPNDNLFFNYNIDTVGAFYYRPNFNLEKCTFCLECSKKCQFGAIAVAPNFLNFFEELCHGCTACSYVCPYEAISDGEREIGKINYNLANSPSLISGCLNYGSTLSTALIRKTKEYADKNKDNFDLLIYDCPPGNSCPAIESIKNVDMVVVVAEPTPFGFHDFKIMEKTLKKLEKNFLIFINKYNNNFSDLKDYCAYNNLEIIGHIRYDKKISKQYSSGKFICDIPEVSEQLYNAYANIINKIEKRK